MIDQKSHEICLVYVRFSIIYLTMKENYRVNVFCFIYSLSHTAPSHGPEFSERKKKFLHN